MAGPASPFLLPLRPEPRDDEVLPRYLAQRRRRRRESEVLVAAAVESLNALAASRGDGRLRPEAPSRKGPNGCAAACQESMPCNIGRATRDYLPMAKPAEEFPEGALAEVLRTKNVYDLGDDSPAAPYDPNKLKVVLETRRRWSAREHVATSSSPTSSSRWAMTNYARSQIPFVRTGTRRWPARTRPNGPSSTRCAGWASPPSASAHAVTSAPSSCGRSTTRSGSCWMRGRSTNFIDLRRRAGWPLRARWQTSTSATSGRPSLQARSARHKERLASRRRSIRTCSARRPHRVRGLVGWLLYQFEVAELSSWFSPGVTHTGFEAGVQEVWSDETRTMEPVDGSEHLWACFAGLPMGWSWAFYFCHAACQSACERGLAHCGLPTVSLADWTPAPFLSAHSAVVAPFLDTANVVAGSKAVASKVLEAVKLELEMLGLAMHDEMEPTQDMEMVGRLFDGRRRMLLPLWQRMWRLWFALSEVSRLRVLAPSQMRRITGHLVDHFAARRGTPCVLNAVYRFVGDDEGPVRPLNQEVLAELRVARGTLPLCGLRLDRPICKRVYVLLGRVGQGVRLARHDGDDRGGLGGRALPRALALQGGRGRGRRA